MGEQAGLATRGRNPDILSCIANLSSDEVFTPPSLANEVLECLAEAWARDHAGANIWADRAVTFLDPACKSGVFLREISRRLIDGLSEEIPDLLARVEHVLCNQVFGIGITQLTSLLARRSVYCSKAADGKHSVVSSFPTSAGNVWFERMTHSAVKGRCEYCGGGSAFLDRDGTLENHAYAFIHTDDVKPHVAQMFGGDVQFDVIIGNPPYQINDEGGHRPVPIYNKFVEQAIALDPSYIAMITPSRWMAGGLGLGEYRRTMLADRRLRALFDYPVASELFPGVKIKGGVSYFLWDRDNPGPCAMTVVRGESSHGPHERVLDQFDILVRDGRAIPILERILESMDAPFSDNVASVRPFGDQLRSNFKKFDREKAAKGQYKLFMNEGNVRRENWIDSSYVTSNQQLVSKWKVLLPTAASDGGQRLPDIVIGKPLIAGPKSVCTETYLAIGPFATKSDAESALSYLRTRFARFLISLRKPGQHNIPSTFAWLPAQKWDREWTDAELFERYGITAEEQLYIESVVKEMLA